METPAEHCARLFDRIAMLRVDNRIEFVKLGWSLGGMFTGRYTLRSGKRVYAVRWKEPAFRAVKDGQWEAPIALVQDGRRTLWTMHDYFYWEDEGSRPTT